MFVYSEALGGGLLVFHEVLQSAENVCFVNYETHGSEKIGFESIFATSLTILYKYGALLRRLFIKLLKDGNISGAWCLS
jgi:hypothetical protein